MSLVPLAPSGMNLMVDRGRLHLRRLSMETGADMDAVPAASVIKVRARSASAVAQAKRVLLCFVGDHRAEIYLDLAGISVPSNGGGGGGARKSGVATAAVERVEPRSTAGGVNASDGSGSGIVGGGGSGGCLLYTSPSPRD